MLNEKNDKRYNRVSEFFSTGEYTFDQTSEILNRLADLEEKVFPLGKERTTVQQLLLLQKSGLLDIILGWNLKVKDSAKFLHLLLNRSADNLEGHISEMINNKWNPSESQKADTIDTLAELGIKPTT